jgi:hypothetical protein
LGGEEGHAAEGASLTKADFSTGWGQAGLGNEVVEAKDIGILEGTQAPPLQPRCGLVERDRPGAHQQAHLSFQFLPVGMAANADSNVLVGGQQSKHTAEVVDGLPQLRRQLLLAAQPKQVEVVFLQARGCGFRPERP